MYYQVIFASHIAGSFFNFFKKLQSNIHIPALFVIAVVFTGCFQHYYRTNNQKSEEAGIIDSLRNANKYFIVHLRYNTMGLENVAVNGDKLEGNMVVLPEEHSKHLDPKPDKSNMFEKKGKVAALLEVHLYTDSRPDDETRLSLPLSSIDRLDVYAFDEKATRKNRIFSVAGIAVSVALVVGFISLAGLASMTL